MRQLLTTPWLESGKCACPPGKANIKILDTKPEAKGLAVRVSKTGTKSWCFEWTIPGTGKKALKSMEATFPATGLAAARQWAQEQRARVEAGEDPREAPAPTGDITIAELFDLRFKNVLALDADNFHKNCLEQERVFDTDVIPKVGKVLVKDFKTAHLNLVIQPIVDRGSVTQSRRVFEMVRALINYAVEKDYIPFSPIAKAKPTGKEKKGDRSLTLTSIKHVMTDIDAILSRSDHVPLIVKIALVTGKRSQEIRSASRGDINEKKMLWTIPKKYIKGEVGAVEDELVPLSPLALALFREAKRRTNNAFLFAREDGEAPIEGGVISHALSRAAERIHVKDAKTGARISLKLKDLRATVGTETIAKKNGLGISRFQKYLMLNHLSAIYANVSDKNYDQNDYLDEKREAMDKWGAFLERLIAGEIDLTEEEEEEIEMQVAA